MRRRRLEKVLLAEYSMLYRLAWSWCHDRQAASDLVQETCMRAMERCSQLRDKDKARSWVVKIMANLHCDRLRAEKETVDVEALDLASPHLVEKVAQREDSIAHIRNAVASLEPNQRLVVTLVDLMEFSYVEVAETLEIPIGTVMSRLSRARKKLKELLLRQEQQAREQPRLRMVQ